MTNQEPVTNCNRRKTDGKLIINKRPVRLSEIQIGAAHDEQPFPSDFLTVNGFAEYMQIHPMTVHRHIRQGIVPGAFKVGGQWRISRERYMESVIGEPSK